LLQGNIPQDEKFEGGTGIPIALDWYGRQMQASRAALVVLPETAIPVLPQQLPAGYLDAMRQRFAAGAQAALVGIPMGSFDEGYTNSVIGLKPGAQLYRFDKHHLVPFGEFIPPLFKWFTRMMNIRGDFNRGPSVAGFRMAGPAPCHICYGTCSARLAAGSPAAAAPTIFVNVSNIAWFGNGRDRPAPADRRMRALEFSAPCRATNTGCRDHRPPGPVTHSLPRHTRGVLTGRSSRNTITPMHGGCPGWGCGVLAAGAGAGRAGRLARQGAGSGRFRAIAG
jgi:apolipoprotein N-acyltransferase